ncbi:DNA recombination protein RmuC [Jatrophihabitans sp. YIM 134969]
MDVPLLVVALAVVAALLLGVLVGAFLTRAPRTGAEAASRTAQDLERRQLAVAGMVGPLTDSLARLDVQLDQLEHDRARTEAGLTAQLRGIAASSEELRRETATLRTALRTPHVRGRWGETQLERTVEAAGMQRHVDFDVQVSSTAPGEDGAAVLRPDMVVHLVGGKHVVVDAKVALTGYLDALEAPDERTRDARLRDHARHLRTHVDTLAGKRYQERFAPSPEFVVCFVPADAVLDAALRADPTLQEHAFGRGVVLATPSTLVALLRTVAYTWRQEALARDAREVHELGRDLYQRLTTLGGHVDKLGRSLTGAVESYNRAVASLESRVFVSARRLRDLGVVDPDDDATVLPAPAQVEATTRTPALPDLGRVS